MRKRKFVQKHENLESKYEIFILSVEKSLKLCYKVKNSELTHQTVASMILVPKSVYVGVNL